MMGILDQSFRLYRRHFWVFVAIIAVVHVPIQLLVQASNIFLIGSLTRYSNPYSPYSPGFGSEPSSGQAVNDMFSNLFVGEAAVLLLGLLYGLLIYLSQGALTAGIADSHMDRPVSFGNSYREMLKHLGSLVGLIVLQILIAIGVFIPALIPAFCAIGAAVGSGSDSGGLLGAACFMFIFLLAGLAFYLFVNIRLQLVVPAAIIENLGPVEAIRRSWRLVEGYSWRTFGLIIVLGILNTVVSLGPAALIAGLAALFIRDNLALQQTISGAVTVLATMFYIPLQLTAITLYYFDLRVRKEGFDLEAAMSQYYAPYGQSGYAQNSGWPGGQYPQAQAGAGGAYPVNPPQLGYQQQPPASGYPQGSPPEGYYGYGGSPDQPNPNQGLQHAGTPTISFAYDPTNPTGGSWPTPQPQEPEPVEPPASAPSEPAPEAPPEIPPPQEPYPTPDWLQRPPEVIPPEQEQIPPDIGSQQSQPDRDDVSGVDKPSGQDDT